MSKITTGAFETMMRYSKLVSEIVQKPVEVAGFIIGEKEVRLFEEQNIENYEAKFEDSVAKAFSEIYERKNVMSYMWHSHANFSTFHSKYDNDHLKHLFEYNEKLCRVLGKKNAELGSVVVNMKEEYYCEKIFSNRKEISLELELEDDPDRKNDSYLVRELGRCVKYSGLKLSELDNFNSVLNKYLEIEKPEKENYTNLMNTYVKQTDGVVEEIVRVLKGDVVDGRNYWRWVDREKRFHELISSVDTKDLENVFRALKLNRYLRRKYPEIYEGIKGRISDD